MKPTPCKLCGRVQSFHFCRTPAPGSKYSTTCKELRLKQIQEEKKARERKLTADLNAGVALGSSNKELTERLKPLTLRSYAEVGKIMVLSPQAVRLIELRALAKIRKLLTPFRGATSGEAKARQVSQPIPSLSD